MIRRIRNRLQSILYHQQYHDRSSALDLTRFRDEVNRFNQSQPNSHLLNAIRAYNHQTVDSFDRSARLHKMRLLEIGASPHGYAMERALELGAKEYTGIGLDVESPVTVRAGNSVGRLLRMDGQALEFPDAFFDRVLSISTFEHVADIRAVLGEIRRVLKPRGKALITFEPVWTCAYGHHLHHFGEIANYMPDWAHLTWTKEEMLLNLQGVWPQKADLTLEKAAHWVYESDAINRVGLPEMRKCFRECGMTVEWMMEMEDRERDRDRLHFVAAKVNLSSSDLMAKGLSVLLSR